MNCYRRSDDGATMVEVSPGNAVNLTAARRLGLVAADAQFSVPIAVTHSDRSEVLAALPARAFLR